MNLTCTYKQQCKMKTLKGGTKNPSCRVGMSEHKEDIDLDFNRIFCIPVNHRHFSSKKC